MSETKYGICISCDHFVHSIRMSTGEIETSQPLFLPMKGIYEIINKCKKNADAKVPFVYTCKQYENKSAPVHMTMPEIEDTLADLIERVAKLEKREATIEKEFRLHERGYVHQNEEK